MIAENIEVGKTYEVIHSRKGKFELTVTKVDDVWVSGLIVGGTAHAILDYNVRQKGEEITIRKTFCSFKEDRKQVDKKK